MHARDLQKHARAGAWNTPADLDALIAAARSTPPGEVARALLPLLTDRSLASQPAHRGRCRLLGELLDGAPGHEVFVLLARALPDADPTLRQTLVALLPRVNHVPGHDALCDALKSPSEEVRVAAAAVLAQVGGKSVVQTLFQWMKDDAFPGRAEALDAVVPRTGHHALPLLQLVVTKGSAPERLRALRYLGDARLMARDLDGAKSVLARCLDDAHPTVMTQAIVAWAGIAAEGEFFDKVGPRLDAPNLAVQRAALEGLRKYRSARAVDAVARKLRMGPGPIRLAALEALEVIATDEVLEPLVEALSHKQLPVRNRAAEAITNLATALKVDLARAVLWLLHSRDVNVRRLAVEIVRKVGDPKGELTPRLLKLLRDEDWWVRERVLDAVVEIAGASLTRHLLEYLQDPSDVIRRHALGGLMRLRDPRAMGAVIRAARDDTDWWVREVAVETLGATGDPRAVPYLVELLREVKELQVACLDALRALDARDAVPDVLALLQSPASEVRLGCVRFLAGLDDSQHAPSLAPLEHDDSPLVRTAARDVLQRWNFVAEARAVEGADRTLSVLDRMLIAIAREKGDDLILHAGRQPSMKKHGRVTPISPTPFTPEQVRAMLMPLLTAAQLDGLQSLEDVDFSYEVRARDLRFRANVFQQITGYGAVFRIVSNDLPAFETLGLPSVVRGFADCKNGLVLVGGPTGSGKSTTLAALIDSINRTDARHIVTLEDPIEVLHASRKSLVNQRERGTHTRSFSAALRSTLRQDPDVILVGEMRDLDTISFAVTAAETGHLVFGTVHTVSADTSIDRVINTFPPGQQPQVRSMLAESLRAVVCQHLLRRANEPGRVLAAEVMINNDAIANMIRKGKTFQIPSVVATSRDLGMTSMDAELARLVREGKVALDEAYMKAVDKKAFEGLVAPGADVRKARTG